MENVKELRHKGRPVIISYTEFPAEIRGQIRGMLSAADDKYYILIDSALPDEIQRKALGHELAHIFLGHTEGGIDHATAEKEAHLLEDAFRQIYEAGELGD